MANTLSISSNIEGLIAGDNVTITGSSAYPIINSSGGGGGGSVNSVTGSTFIGVTGTTDPVITNLGVTSFNLIQGAVSISGGSNVSLDTVGSNISINVSIPPSQAVTSLSGLSGVVTLSPGNNITLNPSGQNIEIAATIPPAVNSLNSLQGAVSLIAGTDIGFATNGNEITINNTAVLPDAGVVSIVGQTGVVTMGSASDTVNITADANNIDLSINLPPIVNTFNSLEGAVTITAGTNIAFTTTGNDIEISASGSAGGVTSVNGVDGAMSLTSNHITFLPDPPNNSLGLQLDVVTSLNTVYGGVNLTSTDASITITPDIGLNTVDLIANFPAPKEAVNTLNGCVGAVDLESSNATVTITPNTETGKIDLTVLGAEPITVVSGQDTQVVVSGSQNTINANYIPANQTLFYWCGRSTSSQNISGGGGDTLSLASLLYNYNNDLALSGIFTVSIAGAYRVIISCLGNSFATGSSASINLITSTSLGNAVVDNIVIGTEPSTTVPYIISLVPTDTITCFAANTFGGSGGYVGNYYMSIELYKRYF